MGKFVKALDGIANKTWNKSLVVFLRLLVGAVFIFSGFVKAVDPTGSYYKFTEYFMAFGLGQWSQFALFGAFAVSAVEFTLGVLILVGAYRRGAPTLALIIMCVMLPLTFRLATTDAVSDCGCFGDAVVLGNWTTFWKNVLLTIPVFYLFLYNRNVPGYYGPAVHWVVMLFSFVFVMAVATVGYVTQPLIDFRPYKTGTTLIAPQSVASDEDYVFIYEKDGEQKEFSIEETPGDDWNYVDRKLKPKDENRQPTNDDESASIAIFDVETGDEVTGDVIDPSRRQLFILFPELPKINVSYAFSLNKLNEFAQNQDVDVIALTSASESQVKWWTDLSMAKYPLYSADDAEIKMLARGNPAIVYAEGGKLLWKRTMGSIDIDRLQEPEMTLAQLVDGFKPGAMLSELIVLYLAAMGVLLLLNRFYPVMKFSINRLFGNKRREDDEVEADVAQVAEPNEVETEADEPDDSKSEE